MRGRDEIGRAEQRRGLGRLLHEHVERRAADMPAVEPGLQRRLVDQPAARAVDDAHALLRLGEVLGRLEVAGGVGQRRVEGDEVGARQQLVQRDLLDAELHRAFGGQERIVGDDLHPEAQRAVGDDRADIARADQAQRLGGELHPHEAVLLPLAGLGGLVRLGQVAGEREHQRDGVLGGGDRVAERRVHHHHAGGGRGGDVDIVDADAGAAHDLELLRRGEHVLGHLGRGTDGEPVIAADHRDQLVLRLAGDLVHLDPALAEDLGGARVHLVGYEYLGHLLVLFLPGRRGSQAPRAS